MFRVVKIIVLLSAVAACAADPAPAPVVTRSLPRLPPIKPPLLNRPTTPTQPVDIAGHLERLNDSVRQTRDRMNAE